MRRHAGRAGKLLPMPIEVSKNFHGDGEEPYFYPEDSGYGETLLPLLLNANTKRTFTILNLFQNWGIAPLKQLSAIKSGDIYGNGQKIQTMTVIIKPMDTANYNNMVQALDEMQICSIGKYVIDKINEDDEKLLTLKGIKFAVD